MSANGNFRYIGFFDLLCDAVYQSRLASEREDSYRMNRHARASISASILSLESFANCLLGSLNLPNRYADEIDKIGVIAKVETYLRENGKEGMDRGRSEVQKITELLRARNDYVHPKESNIGTSLGKPKDKGKHTAIPIELQGETWPMLGIPKRALFWSAHDSAAALRAVSDFFRYVVVHQRGIEPMVALDVFTSRVEVGEHRVLSVFDEFETELRTANQEGFDFSFLGIGEDE